MTIHIFELEDSLSQHIKSIVGIDKLQTIIFIDRESALRFLKEVNISKNKVLIITDDTQCIVHLKNNTLICVKPNLFIKICGNLNLQNVQIALLHKLSVIWNKLEKNISTSLTKACYQSKN